MNRQRQWVAVTALALAMLAAGVVRAEPKLWYVVTNTVAAPDGLSWATAYTNVQVALDNVTPGVTNIIHLAGHTFKSTNALSWASQTNVIMRGGYNATTGTHDPSNQVTILQQTFVGTLWTGRRVIEMNALTNCSLEHVTVTGGSIPGDGGGIHSLNSTVTLDSCVISNNKARISGNWGNRYGGGMYVSGGSIIMRNSRIERNTVISEDGNDTTRGGGIYLASGSLRIEHSTIVSNISQARHESNSFSAGVGHTSGSALTIRNCLIAFNENKHNRLAECTRYGAGVVLENGGLIESSTIASNRTSSTTYAGAGLWVNNGGTVTNTIVWSNTRAAGETSNIGFGGTATEALRVFYSLASELTLTEAPNWNRAANPLFVNAPAGNFRLQNGSPAINAGTNQPWMIGAVDLDGLPRIQQGTVDMGCYETQPPKGTLFMFR